MDAQSNAETLRRAYECWSRSKGTDLSIWEALTTEDLSIRSLGNGAAGLSFSKARDGREGLQDYLKELTACYALEHWTLKKVVSEGDKVVAVADTAWTHRDSGRSFEAAVAIICRFRGGKVYAYEEFYDTSVFDASLH